MLKNKKSQGKSNLPPRETSPVVSTDWLEEHSKDSDLTILDIREPGDYKAGHIPNAINVPFSDLSRGDELSLELPVKNGLFETIGSAGIDSDSRVVVVNNADGKYPLADMTRIAFTLIYGGVREVSVLDGGIEKWEKEDRPTSETIVEPEKKDYEGEIHGELLVSKKYVEKETGEIPIIDARTPEAYFGVIQEPYTHKPGHIPTAKCLPAPWYWNEEGTLKEIKEIREIVESVAEDKKSKLIVYCGVGGFGSAAWFILHELLGYKNVKLFEGSAKEWTSDPDAPVIKYEWE